MIDFIDNFLPYQEYKSVIDYCLNVPYHYGASDNYGERPTGMTSKIRKENYIFKLFNEKIREKVKQVENLSIHRMYVNCFAPEEKAFYHKDKDSVITCLFYVNTEYKINSGGETQFIIGNIGTSVLPIPNRLAFFDANIIHKATAFTDKHRFTIAVKYS